MWQIALIIAGPICVVCLAVMLAFSLWSQHRKSHNPYNYPVEIDGPDQPILGVVSLRDMIEMTTSGSGSGLYSTHFIDCIGYSLIILYRKA